ncbi:phosphotransferase [Pseudoduganella chitinolytica]|uniref:Phosphotransferase n=1 Tax=Pseudoduganella chitinolytica TaxID=34070 RepID=A0ABY8BAG1_9BURK|nr:phosphotransferase [Pseudoduganella chitinolytica]WEF32894.1 phosphotransferase [Pseudoduganella chitinolytica]
MTSDTHPTSLPDTHRLHAYLRAHVDGCAAAPQVTRLAGGQSNPTYLVASGSQRWVLRAKPPGELLPSAHAIEREYRVIAALANSDVPVPRAYALCEDPEVFGTPFYLMAHVDGRILRDPTLPGMAPAERAAMFDELNRVIAALHSVDYAALGLADFGRSGNYVERQVARWTRQYRAAETEPIEAADRLIDWLPRHIPAGDATRIVHGDFRIDNVVFHPTEPRILAVLDWELSTLGHPLSDFAYHCMAWRTAPPVARGLAGQPLADLGIPLEADYLAAYCRRTGRAAVPPEEWEFHIVFNMFRLVGILQGIARRAAQGNAASADAVATGRRARPLAEQAWRMAQRIGA